MTNNYCIDEMKEEVRLKRRLAEVVGKYALAVEENILLRAEVERLNDMISSTSRKERSYVPQIN
jgi:hypothetical protein